MSKISKKDLIGLIQESIYKNLNTENKGSSDNLATKLADLILFGTDESSLDERRGGNIFVINTDDSAKIGFLGAGVTTKQFREMDDEGRAKVIRKFIEKANIAVAERYYLNPRGQKRPPSRVLAFMGTNHEAFRPFKETLKKLEKEMAKFEKKLHKAEEQENDEAINAAEAKIEEIQKALDTITKSLKTKINTITDTAKIDAMAKVIANPQGFQPREIETVMGDDGPQQANKLLQALDMAKVIQFKGTTPGKSNPKLADDEPSDSDIEDANTDFDLRKYLAEGRLFKEDFKNPILDKYLKLKKSIDYKTVFPTDLQGFLDSLDRTERDGLERDLMADLVNKYGQKVIDFTIKVDDLTDDEIADTEYLEDRILTHLEELNPDDLNEEFYAFTREELDALQQYEDTGMFPEWLSDEEGDALVARWRAEYEDDFIDPAGGSGLNSHV